MALDITEIRNVGEFYSQHYLESVLEGDLKDTLKRWSAAEKDGGSKEPAKRLAGLANGYFKSLGEALTLDADDEDEQEQRWKITRDFHARVLDALGYAREPSFAVLDDKTVLPVTLTHTESSRPWLWVCEAPLPIDEDDADPWTEKPSALQLPAGYAGDETVPDLTWRELLDSVVFRLERAPRWVMLLAGPDVFLVDRDKWHQGKYLHFELGKMLGRHDVKALRAASALLHCEVLLPEGGQSLLDSIDEKSHKHAFAVSTDLKFGVQKAIELIGNEAVWYRNKQAKQAVYSYEELAPKLTRECITYLYRLLFLFYVEARGSEVGIVPMQSDAYRMGYSLESLRDLELVPLTSEHANEGYYIHHSLERLFALVQRGHGRGKLATDRGQLNIERQFGESEDLVIDPLRSPLFDPEKTPILSAVKFRNFVLQEVIRLLSLSKEGGGRKSRGRISYAQLGINQLGAVYEGLLSYTGFFTTEDTYEVRNPKEMNDAEARTYFVPASKIEPYKEDEKVKDEHDRAVVHPKGTFLFRLSGREREKSASFYTPEVLTQCLTKYTLKERLGEMDTEGALSADEILELTICEPAMGSGAFLNEAVNQLAHAYLERKQAELGKQIPADEYQREWNRVKYHFVVNNCYGVDLNPLAAELGKVSLWLNVLQPGVQAPFLDLRIRVGNSLIGARREVFDGADLMKKGGKNGDNWLSKVPQRVPLGTKRPEGSVYHFLVPDEGMAPFDKDKVVKQLCPDEVKQIKEWRKEICKPFTKAEVEQLVKISDRIDELWEEHIRVRRELVNKLRQPVNVWGQPDPAEDHRWKSVEEGAETVRELFRPSSAGSRLKAVMDYWCSLWSWPLLDAANLPVREAWLTNVESRLVSNEVDPWDERRFFHWELEFADFFETRKGFDLILGNPPWVKLEWKEAGVLGDWEPLFDVRRQSAKEVADLRGLALESAHLRVAYFNAFSDDSGGQGYLRATSNYSLLSGVQSNLYKCFLVESWKRLSPLGNVGLLHQAGVLDDPKGGGLRESLYSRLRLVARIKNELVLFPEVANQRTYAMTVSGVAVAATGFAAFSNLFHPNTIAGSFEHDGFGAIPGIKDESGHWDLRPHRSRVVWVNEDSLALFAKLYDPPGTPAQQARLPVVHSQEILEVLRRFAEAPRKLGDLDGQYYCTEHFHETNQQKDDTIKRETRFPADVSEWVVSGPHFYVGTPFNKTPNEGCSHNKDYSVIDLTVIPDDYLPRTNYVPACPPAEYKKRTPHWNNRPVTDFYRHVHREMVAPTGERTLAGCIVPPGVAHVHTVFSITFENLVELLDFEGFAASLPVDFFVKSTGMGHVNKTLSEQLPMGGSDELLIQMRWRTLRLNAVSSHYETLWASTRPVALPLVDPDCQGWTGAEWDKLSSQWLRSSPLRAHRHRRQALVELDVLAAIGLGLTLDQLQLLYRVQFPVLQQYERETFYDQRGKIVFTVNRGLSGVGVDRKQWEQIKDAQAGDELPDWAHDAQGPFVPPFDSCDREADMAQAYEYFKKHLGGS